jgi:DNA-directed RNA polymerase subunit alpha
LFSSLPGYAITKVQIDGVDHQFTTLEGMSQDIVDFILNLKQARIASSRKEAGLMKLDIEGPAEVTAADIEPEAGFEVVNQDLVLATLSEGSSISAEMTVTPGVGYKVASNDEVELIGEIPVDAHFSPIVKVSYKVESTRVGRRTDYDKVMMDVTTDGSIEPIEAVRKAAKILSRQFTQIIDPVLPEPEEEEDKLSPEEAETLRLTVEELDLPTRIANALRKGGYKNVGDLVDVPKENVSKVKNLGEKSVEVIDQALEKKGVSLGE